MLFFQLRQSVAEVLTEEKKKEKKNQREEIRENKSNVIEGGWASVG